MIALGFDVGTKFCGWGYFTPGSTEARVKYGVIKETPERYPLLPQIWVLLQDIRPSVIGIEEPQLYSDKYASPQVAKAVFMSLVKTSAVCGKIEGIAYAMGIPVRYYTKSDINKELAGNPQASKVSIQTLVKLYLAMDKTIKPQHANDALACAIVTYNHFSLERRISHVLTEKTS